MGSRLLFCDTSRSAPAEPGWGRRNVRDTVRWSLDAVRLSLLGECALYVIAAGENACMGQLLVGLVKL